MKLLILKTKSQQNKKRKEDSKRVKKTKKADVIEKEIQNTKDKQSDEDKDINVEIRETKSSAPIEVVNIEENASKEKPKKKVGGQNKIYTIYFFSFFFLKCYSDEKNIIIRDAEIEYFLYELILTVSDGYSRNKQPYQPILLSNNAYNAFVTGSNKIFINTGLINKSKSINEIQGVWPMR